MRIVPRWLSSLVAGLMFVQALTGRLYSEQYRDVEWIRTTWAGNDWITLVLVFPLMIAALSSARRGSVRAQLLWSGTIAYAIYNYSFYLLGAELNVFFILYVSTLLSAALSLVLFLSGTNVEDLPGHFAPATPVRVVGGSVAFVGAGLGTVWIGLWAAYALAGRQLPVEPQAFKVVAALDLVLMVPALVGGGGLLWRRRPWGYLIATLASIQGALYLLVLSANSFMAIRRGLANPPGELPVWGPLLGFTTILAVILLACVRSAAPGNRAMG